MNRFVSQITPLFQQKTICEKRHFNNQKILYSLEIGRREWAIMDVTKLAYQKRPAKMEKRSGS